MTVPNKATPTAAEQKLARDLAHIYSIGEASDAIALAFADLRLRYEADRPWVAAQALDDAADDLLTELPGVMVSEDVFDWLTNRSGRLRTDENARRALGGNV